MSTERTGRSRRSSLSFKSITRMLSRDGRGPVSSKSKPAPSISQKFRLTSADTKQKKGTDSSNELRRAALASAASLTLPDSGAVLPDPTSRDNIANGGDSPPQQTVEDLGVKSPLSDPVSSAGTAEGEQTTASSEICNPSTWSTGTGTQKKETKRLQKEKKDLEKQLKRTEDEEEKRESRSTRRESRRLSKKQPFRSSSRSSSVKSVMRSSTTPVFSSFRRSISGSRASSSRDHPGTDTTDTGLATPTFSGPWPERFGAAVSRELASGKQPPYSPYSAPSHTERSLHPTGKFADLRASARLSQTAGVSDKPRVQSMDVSLLYQRQLSSDVLDTENPEGNKENKPNEGDRRSLVDPYTLIPYDDAADVEPEQRSEQRNSGTPRFYANLHNIQGLAGSESTLKGVARRCPSAYVAPGDTKQKERSRLSSPNLTPNTVERPPKYPSVGTNSIGTLSSTTARTESNRYTAVFKSSSTPIPTYTRENSQRSSMLPSRLRSKHTRFTSSPLASSSTYLPELEPNLSQVNKSTPVLLPSQAPSVKPQLPGLRCGEPELFPSSPGNAVESTDGVNLQPGSNKLSQDSPKSHLESSVEPEPTLEEFNGPISESKAVTPTRSYSSKPVPMKPIPKHVTDGNPPARSQTLPTNGQPSRYSTVDAATKSVAPGKETLESPSHARFKHDTVTSVNSETTSEMYSTASENASNESEDHKTAASRRTPSPTFNLFGNGTPLANTVPQTHKNRKSLQADPRHTATLSSTPSLPANSSALRHTSHSSSIAKMFVICCECNFWHDMPSGIYAKLASLHNTTASLPNATSGAGSSSRSRQIENSNGTAARRRSSENKSSININGNSSLRGQNEANTSIKVIPNTSNEENANATRGNDGKSRSSLSPSNSASAVKCSWCDHGMRKSCCAGWSTTVYMQERHH